jgi:hypothetical protein
MYLPLGRLIAQSVMRGRGGQNAVTRYNALESHRGGPEEESSFLVNGLSSQERCGISLRSEAFSPAGKAAHFLSCGLVRPPRSLKNSRAQSLDNSGPPWPLAVRAGRDGRWSKPCLAGHIKLVNPLT